MLGYYITAGISLALLVMIPIWSPTGAQPTYPIWVIMLLAIIVFVVPLVLKRRRRDGAAQTGELAVRVEEVRD
jgi:beta-lactamase regulating signal transducer with metallopeptidase domain